ncbi:MAG: hypothetical protein KAH11_01830 [Rhodospirillales bacterium]|nr:hypothetical protein [Rhodospirillales bacterium]
MNSPAGLSRRLTAVLLLTFLAGCAGANVTPSPAPDTPSTAATNPGPRTAALPKPAPEPASKHEPAIEAPKAAEVIGWDTAALNETFGPASLVRRDLGAEIWQYRTDECVLFLFLYPAGTEGALKVEHLDARGSGTATETCLKSVVRRFVARG